MFQGCVFLCVERKVGVAWVRWGDDWVNSTNSTTLSFDESYLVYLLLTKKPVAPWIVDHFHDVQVDLHLSRVTYPWCEYKRHVYSYLNLGVLCLYPSELCSNQEWNFASVQTFAVIKISHCYSVSLCRVIGLVSAPSHSFLQSAYIGWTSQVPPAALPSAMCSTVMMSLLLLR